MDIAGVAGSGVVVEVARSEGARFEGVLRITANGGDPIGQFKDNSLVGGGGSRGGGVLMLLDSGNLRINSLNGVQATLARPTLLVLRSKAQ